MPIVAATDGSGLEPVRELELYQQAGLPNTEAPQTDVILVDADVSQDITRLRRVHTVFLDGHRLDGAALRRTSGLSGMPQ